MIINNHIHTPYSFSAFDSIDQAFQLAKRESIQVLGINDFFVSDGYEEFSQLSRKYGIFPLFNIEFIGLLQDEQEAHVRVNDPGNPGRTYFCGKGMRNPFSLSEQNRKILEAVIVSSQDQVRQMLDKLGTCLVEAQAKFTLNFEDIKTSYAKELVRERHIAKALRVALHEHYDSEAEKREFLSRLYSGKASTVNLPDNNALEGELRSRLLKAGGAAFVPEDESSFLPIPQLIDIVVDAGGIPCYPVLLDDKNGNYTEFEGDYNNLHQRLSELGIGAVELIPGRNKLENLLPFVRYFHQHGFLVSFGTEHNTPELAPLRVTAAGATELGEYLENINKESACVIAAHQERIKNKQEGYIDSEGHCKMDQRGSFAIEGMEVITRFLELKN